MVALTVEMGFDGNDGKRERESVVEEGRSANSERQLSSSRSGRKVLWSCSRPAVEDTLHDSPPPGSSFLPSFLPFPSPRGCQDTLEPFPLPFISLFHLFLFPLGSCKHSPQEKKGAACLSLSLGPWESHQHQYHTHNTGTFHQSSTLVRRYQCWHCLLPSTSQTKHLGLFFSFFFSIRPAVSQTTQTDWCRARITLLPPLARPQKAQPPPNPKQPSTSNPGKLADGLPAANNARTL
jgi:hypothetical protein